MGNEISTIGGAVATAGTSIAAGVTFGQVDALNNAVVECAKFTGEKASKTIVRHAGETVGSAVAVVGTSVAAGVTFGQVGALNNAVIATANHTAHAAVATGGEVVTLADGVANGIPGVGHIKGGIHYACGDKAGGDQAMKAASRTIGVIGGAGVGVLGGPAGMVAGAVAGGAAMDGITTGVESAIKGEYTPSGQIEAWTKVAKARNGQEVIGGVVAGITTPLMDGLAGYGQAKMKASNSSDIFIDSVRSEGVPVNANPELNAFMAAERAAETGSRASAPSVVSTGSTSSTGSAVSSASVASAASAASGASAGSAVTMEQLNRMLEGGHALERHGALVEMADRPLPGNRIRPNLQLTRFNDNNWMMNELLNAVNSPEGMAAIAEIRNGAARATFDYLVRNAGDIGYTTALMRDLGAMNFPYPAGATVRVVLRNNPVNPMMPNILTFFPNILTSR